MKMASENGVAVVTGAAGGLGSTFAHRLGERRFRLLLVDRRQDKLEQLCQQVADRHDVEAEPYVVDLCNREEVERLAHKLQRLENLELLVNNAGFGTIDYFVDTNVQHLVSMVDLHVAAPVMLIRAALPGMIERNRGAIVNVASVAAWLQSAGNVQYGATKCFLTTFSNSLHQELRGTNVRVQALCPGFVRTEFHDAETMKGFDRLKAPKSRFWMSADEVVECSLRELSGKRVIVIPGLGYRAFGRLAQMPLLRPLIQRITRGPRLTTPEPSPATETSPAIGPSPAPETANLP